MEWSHNYKPILLQYFDSSDFLIIISFSSLGLRESPGYNLKFYSDIQMSFERCSFPKANFSFVKLPVIFAIFKNKKILLPNPFLTLVWIKKVCNFSLSQFIFKTQLILNQGPNI